MTNRLSLLERELTDSSGLPVQYAYRGDAEYTFSVAAEKPRADQILEEARQRLGRPADWTQKYDEELASGFAYFSL